MYAWVWNFAIVVKITPHTHTHCGTQSAMQPKPNRAENEMENIATRSSEIKKK